MITKFEKYQLITEDPDYISIDDNNYYRATSQNARPFGLDEKTNKLIIGMPGTYHYNNDIDIELSEIDKPLNEAIFCGRIWVKDKILTFWIFPEIDLFKTIIKKLETQLNIKIFNNNWRMEILKYDNDEIHIGERSDGWRATNTIIPIEDYIGSLDVPEEQKLWHLMNAEEKRIAKLKGKAPDFKGWGSDLTAWDSRRPLPYRQAIYQENKN